MMLELSAEQAEAHEAFKEFAATRVEPEADRIDREEWIPQELVEQLAAAGYFGSGLPERYGGCHSDPITHGLMHEALGRASASVQGLVNVHHMASSAIARWGSKAQKKSWIARLAAGELRAAIAITEPEVGSDAKDVRTTAERDGDSFVLRGTKKWITCGQSADVFVILTRCEGQPTVFIVPREAEGFSAHPIRGLLGCRGYMLAELHLEGCRIPAENLVGQVGFGLTHVAAAGLDNGRYNLAWACVGIGQACLDASFNYARERCQFGDHLLGFQLIQRMLTQMMTQVNAARWLCCRAGYLRSCRDPKAMMETAMAKYFATTMLHQVTHDAVQIHGASGCSSERPLQRYMRDGRITEIIETSTQMLEVMLSSYGAEESS